MRGRSDERRPRWSRKSDAAVAIGLIFVALGLALYTFIARWGLDFDYIAGSWPTYLEAAQLTVVYTTISYVVGMGIGFLVGWVRASRPVPLDKVLRDYKRSRDAKSGDGSRGSYPIGTIALHGLRYSLRRIGDGYVAVIRGTPLFVQIIFAWSVLLINYPSLAPLTIAIIAALAALTFNTGAYQSEIFRAGIQTVHSGQVEAARAVGLSRWGAMRHVVLPQALRLVIPPLTNEYVGLLKASSFILIVGIIELTAHARGEAFVTGRVFEAFALTAAIYLLITVPISKIVEFLERRLRIPGLGIQQSRPAGAGRTRA